MSKVNAMGEYQRCDRCLCRTCRENIGNCGIMKGSCSGCITCVGTILKCPNDKYLAKGEEG